MSDYIPTIKVWHDSSKKADEVVAQIERWSEILGWEMPHRIILTDELSIQIGSQTFWKEDSMSREINRFAHKYGPSVST
jgi:hypothetical protein